MVILLSLLTSLLRNKLWNMLYSYLQIQLEIRGLLIIVEICTYIYLSMCVCVYVCVCVCVCEGVLVDVIYSDYMRLHLYQHKTFHYMVLQYWQYCIHIVVHDADQKSKPLHQICHTLSFNGEQGLKKQFDKNYLLNRLLHSVRKSKMLH